MQKLDRLGWAAERVFTAHGVRYGLRSNTELALDACLPLLPPDSRPDGPGIVDRLFSIRVPDGPVRPGVRRYHLVYSNWTRIARELDLEQAHRMLEQDLHLFVAEKAPRKIFVHAGVVGWRGRALVLPGRSFAGKSTLVSALVRAGATYYSDEFAVFDGMGQVHPFPRPLSLRREGQSPLRCPAESLGAEVGKQALPVGLVLVTQFREGARWRPKALSTGQGLLAMLANTVPARERPAEALATLKNVVSQATILRGNRGEAEAVARRILGELW